MKINRARRSSLVLSGALALMVTACAPPTVVPQRAPQAASQPAPRPAPAPAPVTPPAQTPRASQDWRDAPQTVGNWSQQGGTARFGPGEATLFALACNRAGRTVSLVRTGASTVSLPMTIVTTSDTRPLSADPAPQGQPQLIATLAANDALLDSMAFSRGRFAVEVNGLPTLYLPAWAEVGRVIEDCRK